MNDVVQVRNIGVRYIKYNNIKRQGFKTLLFDTLQGKRINRQEFWALKGVSLTMHQGEIIGIIGSNGAGKSTLCRVLSHILMPDTGELEIQGLVSALLSLGTGFNAELTGRENIFLNGMMLGFSFKEIEQVYDEIVEFADIGPFIKQPIKQYSKGMKSRLGFSIAAMLEPEILILDETLNAGDEHFKAKASMKMAELMEHAKLVILVSHDLRFIETRCSRVIWLEKGKIKGEGDPGTMCEAYRNYAVKPKTKKKILETYTKTQQRSLGEEIIVVDDASITYRVDRKDFKALDGVSFSIKKGEIFGIIGHNGAGKSTLCKLLSGIIRTETGAVNVDGRTTEILGFGSGFNKELSGMDNIYLNGLLLGIPKHTLEAHLDEIIKFSGLGNAIHDSMREYSSGMVSRLGFSIATSIDPEILIIDEALSAGDYAFQEKAASRIQTMMNKAKAVIVVTHNMNFVRNICTRVMWLDRGKVMAIGEPDEVVDGYTRTAKR